MLSVMRDLFNMFWWGDWNYSIPIEIRETADAIEVIAAIPGVDKDNVDVNVGPDTVRISVHASEKTNKNGNVLYSEFITTTSERIISLPDTIVPEQAKGEFSNGLLKLTLPKKTTTNNVRIKL